jgi:hypothetical protein
MSFNRREFTVALSALAISSGNAMAAGRVPNQSERNPEPMIIFQTFPFGEQPPGDYVQGRTTYDRFMKSHKPNLEKLGYTVYITTELPT